MEVSVERIVEGGHELVLAGLPPSSRVLFHLKHPPSSLYVPPSHTATKISFIMVATKDVKVEFDPKNSELLRPRTASRAPG